MEDNMGTGYFTPTERITADGMWSESELSENIQDECLISTTYVKYKDRALFNKNVLLPQYMAESIITNNDLIYVYNNEALKDTKAYGIALFDKWIHNEIKIILEASVVM